MGRESELRISQFLASAGAKMDDRQSVRQIGRQNNGQTHKMEERYIIIISLLLHHPAPSSALCSASSLVVSAKPNQQQAAPASPTMELSLACRWLTRLVELVLSVSHLTPHLSI